MRQDAISDVIAPRAPAQEVFRKHNIGKLRWTLIPWDAMTEIVKVLTKGAEKYSPGNWQLSTDPVKDYGDALLRHVSARLNGEINDEEWGLPHLAHAGCCLLFLLALDLRKR